MKVGKGRRGCKMIKGGTNKMGCGRIMQEERRFKHIEKCKKGRKRDGFP
jgi:hypothetical protein